MDNSPVNSVIDSTLLSYNHSATGLFRITLDVSGKDAIKHAKLILAQCEDNQTMGLAPITKEAARTKLTDDFIKRPKKELCGEARAWMERERINQIPSVYAAHLCTLKNYQTYSVSTNEKDAANAMRGFCNVASRGDFDTDFVALQNFIKDIALYRQFVQESQT